MSDDDDLAPSTSDLKNFQQLLFEQKEQNPSKFVSYWEADENDIEEVTEEDKMKDPVKKFLWAAETGNLNILKEMLASDGQLIFANDNDGYTALHRAAYEGQVGAIKLLLAKGANVNAFTNDGWTALHSSCFWGQVEVADLLLRQKNCDINARTNGLQTPLHLAAQNASSLPLFLLLLMHPNINPTLLNQVGEKAADIANRNLKFHEVFSITDDNINVL